MVQDNPQVPSHLVGVTLVQVCAQDTGCYKWTSRDINQPPGLGPILIPCKHNDDEYNVSERKDNQARYVQVSDRFSPPCVSLLSTRWWRHYSHSWPPEQLCPLWVRAISFICLFFLFDRLQTSTHPLGTLVWGPLGIRQMQQPFFVPSFHVEKINVQRKLIPPMHPLPKKQWVALYSQ
jgi:hypothetical protein